MKWILLLAFISIGSYCVSFLKNDRRSSYVVGLLIGFLPFVIGPWHLMTAPYATPMWVGYCKGWEVSLIDAIAVAILIARPGKGVSNPFFWPLMAYIGAVMVAFMMADFKMFAFAYVLQIVRMLVLLLAVCRLAARAEGAKGVFYGLVAGMTLQCGLALNDKLHGAIQTGGSFGHQNMLGFVTHMVLMPSFGLLLGGRWTRVATVGVLAGACIVIVGASRATVVVAGAGVILTYMVAAIINWTPQKARVGFMALAAMAVAVPFAMQALNHRFEVRGGKLLDEDGEREAFENAAGMIIDDHPLGVGPNHYVYVANTKGYNNRAKIGWASGSRSANVHNSYLLVHAETGYLGLLGLWAILLVGAYACFHYARKYRRQGYSELLVGIGCSVVCITIHCKFEWMFVTFQAQYVLFIVLGLAAGCITQSRMIRNRRPRPKAARPSPASGVPAVREVELAALSGAG